MPRSYVPNAPHYVANAGLTLSSWRGWSASLRMRAINHYRLDEQDPSVVASGHMVFDFGLARRIRRGVEFNLTIDNLTDRSYYETQNYAELLRIGTSRPTAHGPDPCHAWLPARRYGRPDVPLAREMTSRGDIVSLQFIENKEFT